VLLGAFCQKQVESKGWSPLPTVEKCVLEHGGPFLFWVVNTLRLLFLSVLPKLRV
jgi:hypothetical protein